MKRRDARIQALWDQLCAAARDAAAADVRDEVVGVLAGLAEKVERLTAESVARNRQMQELIERIKREGIADGHG